MKSGGEEYGVWQRIEADLKLLYYWNLMQQSEQQWVLDKCF